MAIVGLGDIDVDTTVSGTGEASASQTFTQSANATYNVDVSSTYTASPSSFGGSGSFSGSFNVVEDNSLGENPVPYTAACIFDHRGDPVSVTYDVSVDHDDVSVYVDGTDHQNSASGTDTIETIRIVRTSESGFDYSCSYSWSVNQSISSDGNIDSITQS